MSKRFKRKTCVYCGKPGASSTGDHVLARQFALERHRANLPQVPACRACNGVKAEVEHYLCTVMPFGAQHADARENLVTMVPKRLAKNAALHREITETLKPTWVHDPSGLLVRRSAVHIDAEKLERWITMVVKGLIWHHWQVIAGNDFDVEVMMFSDQGADQFSQLLQTNGERVKAATIGGGALTYEGIGEAGRLPVSLWRLLVYDGVELTGDDPHSRARDYFVTVRPIRERPATPEDAS